MAAITIIGGGPAGLAAANALAAAGAQFTLHDTGLPIRSRRHTEASELGVGIGGAGLFSDGKFSYYPSGTHLYALNDQEKLVKSYRSVCKMLDHSGIGTIDLPAEVGFADQTSPFGQKRYPSTYGTLDQRLMLAQHMLDGIDPMWIRSASRVDRVSRRGLGFQVTSLGMGGGTTIDENATHLILATGRFGGDALGKMMGGPSVTDESRYEIGIRIEHANGRGFFLNNENPDIKLIMKRDELEVRTFCTCRSGEVWLIPYDDLSALSGRSDGPPSGFSNFGLLPRFTGDRVDQGRDTWDHFRSTWGSRDGALWQTLPQFLRGESTSPGGPAPDRPWHPREKFEWGDIGAAMHHRLRSTLIESLTRLVARFPDLASDDTLCLYPAVEGAGFFPRTDRSLRVPGENIWCCGDVVGRFRGLIPALVSGYYAGLQVASLVEDRGGTGRPQC